jgi:hypothetical protein
MRVAEKLDWKGLTLHTVGITASNTLLVDHHFLMCVLLRRALSGANIVSA